MKYSLKTKNYNASLKNESIVGDTVVCDKCKWSWAIDDGGDHPYTCKCGHVNKPIHSNKNMEPILTLEQYKIALNEKKSPYDRETLLHYKDDYEKGKEIPFGVKSSLIAQGMIAREGGDDEGKKVKSPEYSSEDHELQHYSGVWEEKKKPGPDPYMKGLDDETEEDKEDQMKKQAKMDDDNPKAYKELPGDKEAREKGEVKTSKHTKKYHELYGDKKDESISIDEAEDDKQSTDRSPMDGAMETALKKKSEESGVPIGILRAVMRRGLAAWKSGHRPGANQQQWGYARVNAFLTKGEGTWGGADKDLAKEVRDGGHDKDMK